MSERGRGGEKSDVGDAPPTEPVHSSTADTPAPESTKEGTTSIGISSLSLVDKGKGPATPTTPTTADAATTGTESERSESEHGKDETGTVSPDQPRQVIAVSVSKGPSAFFNLARKFLVTDEVCDLSALEGAIVSAVDAAHLLERSKIATIVRINTSYVAVEPKRRKEHVPSSVGEEASGTAPATETGATSATTGSPPTQPQARDSAMPVAAAGPGTPRIDQPTVASSNIHHSSTASASQGKPKSSAGTMRRARIVITVKRTEAYEKWLEDNPVHDTHAGQDDDHI